MTERSWSDWQKWWMDIAKTVVGAGLGFAFAFLVFDHFEQDRAERRALCSQQVGRMHTAHSNLHAASSSYRTVTRNTFIELYRWRDEQPTELMRRWWGSTYAELDAALRSFQAAFPGSSHEVSLMRQAMQQAYDSIDGELIDRRLDRIEAMYRDPRPPTAEERWTATLPLSRATLENYRPRVEAAVKNMEEAQSRLSDIASGRLSRPASAICAQR